MTYTGRGKYFKELDMDWSGVDIKDNTGARQRGSSLPVSAHARTINPPPLDLQQMLTPQKFRKMLRKF